MRAMVVSVSGCLIAMLACGGETKESSSSGGASGSAGSAAASGVGGSGGTAGTPGAGGSAGGSGGSSGVGGAPVGCPLAPPVVGTACSSGAAVCVYECESCFCATGSWECSAKPCTKPCSNPGAWCTTTGTACQCWGGDWECEATSDAGAGLDPDLLPQLISEGQPCASSELSCAPKGKNGASCICAEGKWECAPEAPPNDGCPASFDEGQNCSPEGLLCTKSGFCPPTCVCQLDSTWACATFTPC
jgi:hypothetical protein